MSAPHDQRWHDRYDEIPRAVDSAVDKYKLNAGSHPQLADPDLNISLAEVHNTFRKWLGEKYDTDLIDAVAAAGASERLKGDPLWLSVISGPGAAKT